MICWKVITGCLRNFLCLPRKAMQARKNHIWTCSHIQTWCPISKTGWKMIPCIWWVPYMRGQRCADITRLRQDLGKRRSPDLAGREERSTLWWQKPSLDTNREILFMMIPVHSKLIRYQGCLIWRDCWVGLTISRQMTEIMRSMLSSLYIGYRSIRNCMSNAVFENVTRWLLMWVSFWDFPIPRILLCHRLQKTSSLLSII